MLYNIYSIISGKTVRQHERFYKKYKKRNKFVLGNLVRTNRGYFIDGCQVDLKSVELWRFFNEESSNQATREAGLTAAKEAYDAWQKELKRLEELKKANEEA